MFPIPIRPVKSSLLKGGNPGNENQNIILSIEVSDIDTFYAKAKELNYEIVHDITNEPWGVRRFWMKDPSEVAINLMAHIQQ